MKHASLFAFLTNSHGAGEAEADKRGGPYSLPVPNLNTQHTLRAPQAEPASKERHTEGTNGRHTHACTHTQRKRERAREKGLTVLIPFCCINSNSSDSTAGVIHAKLTTNNNKKKTKPKAHHTHASSSRHLWSR